MKCIERASADVGFMFISYNLRRIGNILPVNVLKEYLGILLTLFLALYDLSGRKISLNGVSFSTGMVSPPPGYKNCLNQFFWYEKYPSEKVIRQTPEICHAVL